MDTAQRTLQMAAKREYIVRILRYRARHYIWIVKYGGLKNIENRLQQNFFVFCVYGDQHFCCYEEERKTQ